AKAGEAASDLVDPEWKAQLTGLGYTGGATSGAKAHSEATSGTSASAPAATPLYEVKAGDTLASIAQQQLGDASLAADLARLNGLPDNGQLQPGLKLRLH